MRNERVGVEKHRVVGRLCFWLDPPVGGGWLCGLASEPVQGSALALQCVDHVHRGHGLAPSVLRVGDSVADDVLEERLQDAPRLLVDGPADALHASSSRQASDGGLGDAEDVVAQHLAVALRTPLAQSLASLSSSRHVLAACVAG